MSTLRRRLPCFAALVALVVPLLAGGGVAEAEELPEPRREFRAAWIATVANIDWPSRRDMPMDEAKAELVAQLDRLVEMNMNAVVFQIRPTGDALYRSELEPWSEWLTGEAGKAPSPMWDPLEFAVEEAHARGIELHVWFNPYRAKHAGSETDPVAPALAATNPSVVKQYGNQMWMDPGEPAVQRHSLAVVLDVTRRYDIDGVHMDDYFYPYPVRDDDGNEIDFPDDASFAAYVEGGGKLSRDDWRRKSVNDFVQEMYAGVKAIKPHVKVGLSPFGIYRPGHPEFIQGFDQYDKLYADPALWLREGWMDYVTPQLYWPIAPPQQSFTALLSWWDDHNPMERHVWPGLAPYRHFNDERGRYPVEEFVYQVQYARHLTSVSDGHIHFSMKWLMPLEGGNALADRLSDAVYDEPAMVPATPWLAGDAELPAAPAVRSVAVRSEEVEVTIDPRAAASGPRWVVQVERDGSWFEAFGDPRDATVTVATEGGGAVDRVAVRLADRFGRLGEATIREGGR